MSRAERIAALLAGAGKLARCKGARGDWVRATMAAWRAAQRAMDKRCDEAVDRLDEEAFERLCDEEEAKVDVFRAPIIAVVERDVWPRTLYFGEI